MIETMTDVLNINAIATEAGYRRVVAALNELLDAGGANERDPLAGLVDTLGEMIESYEARVHPMPEASPRDALAFLMEQHGLKQTDLAGIAPQGAISAILTGRREISKQLALKLAKRFAVPVGVFV